MKITVVGGGNIGTLMAGEFAAKGHEVTILSSKPERFSKTIDVLDENTTVLMTGELKLITSDLKEAVDGAEMIWITYPAQMFESFGKELAPYIKPGQMVGVVPGAGGAEFAFKGVLEKGGILFGLQRVHSISRLEVYGHSVHMLGRKPKLELAAIPTSETQRISGLVHDLFDLPVTPLPNYLSVTLTPSNPILHTTRLYSMFKDYKPGDVYDRNFLFYEEWSDLASEMLFACDKELQVLCNTIPLDLSNVMSLPEYYESPTIKAMTAKISGIKAFKGLTSPMVPQDKDWIPDFNSRYFTTDFPYGLKIIKDLCVIFNVDTPNIDTVWNWYASFDPQHAATAISLLHLTQEDVVKLYM